MKTSASAQIISKAAPLVCSDCGNTQRFFEIMAVETHLVDGRLNYLHLVDAIVDHYVCCECGESLPVPPWAKPPEPSAACENQ